MRIRPLYLLIGAALGLAAGLIFGWVVSPVEYVNTAPSSLRADYRTDYILMTAQAYAADGDLTLAQRRLAALGPHPGLDEVVAAIDYATQHSFSSADLQVLNQLGVALRRAPGTPEIGGP
jgi:hypothetical protein